MINLTRWHQGQGLAVVYAECRPRA